MTPTEGTPSQSRTIWVIYKYFWDDIEAVEAHSDSMVAQRRSEELQDAENLRSEVAPYGFAVWEIPLDPQP